MTGDDPLWLIASDHGSAKLIDHSEKSVYAFSPVAFAAEGAHYLVQSRTVSLVLPRLRPLTDGFRRNQDVSIASLPKGICIDRELPTTRIPRDRRYGSFTFDIDSGFYVAGALFDTVFMNFDEEGVPVFVNDCTSFTAMRRECEQD